MRRILLFVAALAAASVIPAATPVYVTPDVPTTEALGPSTLLPSGIYEYDGASYTLALLVPGAADVNAIHKMDEPGDWLFSVEAPSDLAGALPSPAQARDVIRYDSSAGTYSLCLSGAAVGIGAGKSVDAIYMDGGDKGELILSFDVPTGIPPFTGPSSFEPADLVRFVPSGAGIVCPGWSLAAANPVLDASAIGAGVAIRINLDGAERAGTKTVFTLDIPAVVAPPATTVLPGLIGEYDPGVGTFGIFETLGGWPIRGIVDGVSCGGNAGRVPTTILLGKAASPDIVIGWSASCSSGAQDYGIYEGDIGSWYSHTLLDCSDSGADLSEQVTPTGVDKYYLVVAHSTCKGEEGSYGLCTAGFCGFGDERPVGAGVCVPSQVLTPCP